MSAGDRNIGGKPKDIVRHFSSKEGGEPICLTKRYGYSTTDISDVTCIKCINKTMKKSKYKRGDKVYSYLNPSEPMEVAFVEFRPWESKLKPHDNDTYAYKVTIRDKDGGSHSSKWIDESSISTTPINKMKKGGMVFSEFRDHYCNYGALIIGGYDTDDIMADGGSINGKKQKNMKNNHINGEIKNDPLDKDIVRDKTGRSIFIADKWKAGKNEVSKEESEANAKELVKRWNMYPQLVALLKRTLPNMSAEKLKEEIKRLLNEANEAD